MKIPTWMKLTLFVVSVPALLAAVALAERVNVEKERRRRLAELARRERESLD